MSKEGGPHTIRVPLRKIGSALPALALITGGILFSSSAAPLPGIQAGAVSSDSPAIVVPDVAITLSSPRIQDDSSPLAGAAASGPAAPAEPLAPILPVDTIAGTSSLVTLDSTGIPVRALEAYRTADTLMDSADPVCHLDWALVAAIGRVESNHARFGGNQLDSAGVAQPGIIGIALDGSNNTARITDSDNGLLDRDTTYDRAVGPMQFIPSTWRSAGTDADGDGVKNPQDMADAATASAIYLCSGPGDLSLPDDLRSAILRYNASDSYAQMVTAIAEAYRHGVSALPASDLVPAKTTPATEGAAARSASGPAAPAGADVTLPAPPAPGAPVPARPVPGAPAPATPAPTSAAPAPPAPSTPVPTTTVPSTPVPSTPVPTTTVPSTTVPTTPVPCTPVPTTSTPITPGPTPTVPPATPVPCEPVPCLPSTDPATPCPTPTVATLPSTPGPTV